MAPAKTPREIIVRLNQEIAGILGERAARERMAANDFEPTVSSPEEFGAFIKREIDKWGRVVRATGARPE